MSQIVEHNEINDHVEEIAKNLLVAHQFYTTSMTKINGTPLFFFTALIVKHVWLLGTPEQVADLGDHWCR